MKRLKWLGRFLLGCAIGAGVWAGSLIVMTGEPFAPILQALYSLDQVSRRFAEDPWLDDNDEMPATSRSQYVKPHWDRVLVDRTAEALERLEKDRFVELDYETAEHFTGIATTGGTPYLVRALRGPTKIERQPIVVRIDGKFARLNLWPSMDCL